MKKPVLLERHVQMQPIVVLLLSGLHVNLHIESRLHVLRTCNVRTCSAMVHGNDLGPLGNSMHRVKHTANAVPTFLISY
ncbi:hypothetical protein ACLOJK_010174 [Asimina triloba]